MSCANFEMYIYVGGFGDTAGAMDTVDNPDPVFADFPSVVLGGDQAVIQFKSTQGAASFYSQAYARYQKCSDFTALSAVSFYANTSVVLAGTNVYTIDDVDGTNDPISASLLGTFVHRVQALYKHH